MAQLKPVSFSTQQSVEDADLARRLALAQQLQQQSMDSEPVRQQGNIVTGPSWTQGLARLLNAYTARKMQEQAQAEQVKLAGEREARNSADTSMLAQALQGRPAQTAGLSEDAAGNVSQMPAMPAQTPQQSLTQAIPLMGPQMQPVALQMLMSQLPKPESSFTLNPGDVRFGPDGRPIASAPQKQEGFTLAPGATRYGPQGQPIVSAPGHGPEDRPYFTPVSTPEGVMRFNARTGTMEPVQVGGRIPMKAADSPVHQARVAESKKTGMEMGEYVGKAQADAALAAVSNRYLDNMDMAAKDFTPGKLAPMQSSLIQWAQAAGVPISEEDRKAAGSIQALTSMAIKMAGQATRQSDAQPSQLQYFKILESMPNEGRTPEGFRAIMSYLRDTNNYAVEKHAQLTQWRATHGGSAEGFEAQWPEMAKKLPLVWNQQKPAAPRPSGVPRFANEAEAQAAGLRPGTRVIINGVSGTWR